jgi:hypothetical protein
MWHGPPHIQIWITAFARANDPAAHSLPPDRPATQRLTAPAIPARITCRRVIDIVFSCATLEQKPEARSQKQEERPVAPYFVFWLLTIDSWLFWLLASNV